MGEAVLVIDDEKGMRWALEKALQGEGYRVITADNGYDGISALDASSDVSLVLLDYKMPLIDGLETLVKIKQHHPNIPVIFMTAFSSMPTALEALKRGAVGYITKPFQLGDLKAAVKKAIDQAMFIN
ncbi:MAG: response regulator [Actinobacteria bacterium]|nr:response regulator [Actinomycetota bacterium]